MDETEKELIRDRTDIVELISAYTTLKQAGKTFKGLCPFHQEKTPSFTVNPELRRYHCFGCGASGDVFTFLEKKENLTFLEAAERLAMRAGITLSRRGVAPEEIRRQQSEKDRLFAANAAALRFFRGSYRRATLAQEYAAKRGLVHDTLESFGIGFAPDDWGQLAHFLLEREKIHPDDAIRAGLITASRRMEGEFIDRFRGRFMFPIVDVQERVIGFGGRLIVDKQNDPKYLNSPETPIFSKSKTLYALNRARKAIQEQNVAVIVEGYMDVVAAHQAGIACVVATLGTAMTAEHVSLLRRYTKNIVLSFDADPAGVKAALKAAELITAGGEDMTLKVLALPQGEDPDSLIRKGDAAAFRKAIDNAVSVPEFQLTLLRRQSTVTSSGECLEFLKKASEVIAPLPRKAEIEALNRQVASYREVLPFFSATEAERIVRDEIKQIIRQRGGSGPEDSTDMDLGKLRSESGYIERPSPRGDSGYRRDQRPRGSSYGEQRWGRERAPMHLPAVYHPLAAEVAERTLIRAALSEELLPTVRRVLATLAEPLAFVNPLTGLLFEALQPVITGKVDPQALLSRLTDPELAAYADAVLLDESGPGLSIGAVEDAVLQLKKRQIRAKNEQIRSEIAQKEGGGPPDAEKLRQYMLRQKALRGGRGTNDGGG